jgi:hypothetical protein
MMDYQEMHRIRYMLLDFSLFLINERFRDEAPFITLAETLKIVDEFTKKTMGFCLCKTCKEQENGDSIHQEASEAESSE